MPRFELAHRRRRCGRLVASVALLAGTTLCGGAGAAWADDGDDGKINIVQRFSDRGRTIQDGQDVTVTPDQFELVKQTDAYGIHVAPGSIPDWYSGGRLYLYRSGITLLHTDRESGEQKPILSTGVWMIPSVRARYTTVRVLGLAADDERIYVATWTMSVFDAPWGDGDGRSRRLTPSHPGPGYALLVFRASDGQEVSRLRVPIEYQPAWSIPRHPRLPAPIEDEPDADLGQGEEGRAPREELPEETVEAGALTLIADGVSVSLVGQRFVFDGDRLTRQDAGDEKENKADDRGRRR